MLLNKETKSNQTKPFFFSYLFPSFSFLLFLLSHSFFLLKTFRLSFFLSFFFPPCFRLFFILPFSVSIFISNQCFFSYYFFFNSNTDFLLQNQWWSFPSFSSAEAPWRNGQIDWLIAVSDLANSNSSYSISSPLSAYPRLIFIKIRKNTFIIWICFSPRLIFIDFILCMYVYF